MCDTTNTLIPKEARAPNPCRRLFCGHGTRLVAVPPFYEPHVIKTIEDGDFGNASQVVDAWAQSLISFALFHFSRAVLNAVHVSSWSLPFPCCIFDLVMPILILILPIKICMEDIIYPPPAKSESNVGFHSYNP